LITQLVKAATSAPVTDIAERTMLTLLMVLIIGLAFLGMRKGWLNKSKRVIAEIETRQPTNVNPLTSPCEARFAGTTTAGNWLDRITNQGLGTPRSITIQIFREGIYLTDDGQFNLWLDSDAIKEISTNRGIAGDVVDQAGMLKFTWHLGDLLVDTGVRVNRHLDHELIVEALQTFPSAAASVNQMKTQSMEAGE
jgi:hypothetical protein